MQNVETFTNISVCKACQKEV